MKNLFYVFSVSFLKYQLANKLFAFLLFLFLLLPQYACNTTEPPSNQTLSLKLEDVSCTEAWLQLTSTNIQIPNNISLLINGIVKKTYTLNTQDSLLYIDSLLPNQNYSFQVSIIQNQESSILSNELNVTTMDTTSHNFTWQTFTFGEAGAGSSVLYDVAIIDENNIWAVGEIYMLDSLGNPDPIAYNAICWNGSEWKVKKIAVTYKGNQTIAPLKGIFVLPSGEIIFSSGLPYLPQGNYWKLYHLWDMGVLDQNDGSVDRIWGTSINDLYFVGGKGTIAHYQNGSWTKIESGTDLNINDIWGDYNDKTGEWEILTVGGNILHGGVTERVILEINGNQAHQLNADGTNWPLRTIWFRSSKKYYVAGSGVYEKHSINQNIWENDIYDITSYAINVLRGTFLNDIAATGGVGELIHFNGCSWRSYLENTQLTSGNYYGIDIRDNTIVAVGINNPQAVITIGKRIN